MLYTWSIWYVLRVHVQGAVRALALLVHAIAIDCDYICGNPGGMNKRKLRDQEEVHASSYQS